eukprot:gene40495-41519_t
MSSWAHPQVVQFCHDQEEHALQKANEHGGTLDQLAQNSGVDYSEFTIRHLRKLHTQGSPVASPADIQEMRRLGRGLITEDAHHSAISWYEEWKRQKKIEKQMNA